jgi:hypothetical protein
MIDVSPSDFLKLYGGLVRMLQAIEKAGQTGLSTNEAGLKVFNSRYYGWRMLKQASKLGYITREKLPREEGGGHYYVVNKLTSAGRKLLEELK